MKANGLSILLVFSGSIIASWGLVMLCITQLNRMGRDAVALGLVLFVIGLVADIIDGEIDE